MTDDGLAFKAMEKRCANLALVPSDKPFALRLDGHGFSKVVKSSDLAKNFVWPYDVRFERMMTNTASRLGQHFDADVVYTMSDEITLVFHKATKFGRRAFKYVTLASSLCAALFYQELLKEFPGVVPKVPPYFDCRWFSLELEDVSRLLKWRIASEMKNSCSNVAFSHYRGKGHLLKGMYAPKMNQKLVTEKGLAKSWDFYPDSYKYGVLMYKVRVLVKKPPLVKKVQGETKTFLRDAERTAWKTESFDFSQMKDGVFLSMVLTDYLDRMKSKKDADRQKTKENQEK